MFINLLTSHLFVFKVSIIQISGGYMAKVLCVLYDDPANGGYPTSYARDSIPTISRYPDGQTLPTPH